MCVCVCVRVCVYEQEVHRGRILRKISYVSLYSVNTVGVKNQHCGSICLWEFNTGYSHNVPIAGLCVCVCVCLCACVSLCVCAFLSVYFNVEVHL